MAEIFDYDVFLSFAATDEDIVRPVWQELCLSGLRVFWSDATLKQRLGESWFDSIESSLERSRHFVLIASQSSMSSTWVKREYQAFLQSCYKPGLRRLIPILVGNYQSSQLPLFLRELQGLRLEGSNLPAQLVELLGGTNVEDLKASLIEKEGENRQLSEELRARQSQLSSLSQQLAATTSENTALRSEARNLPSEVATMRSQLSSAREQLASVTSENVQLRSEARNRPDKLAALQSELSSAKQLLFSITSENERLRSQLRNTATTATTSKNTAHAASVRVAWSHVIVAAIAYWFLGALWFTAFSRPWIAGVRIPPEELEAYKAHPELGLYAVALLLNLVLAYVIAYALAVGESHDLFRGIRVGILAGLAVAVCMANELVFEMRSPSFIAIAAGYPLVGCILMGIILGAWKPKVEAELSRETSHHEN